MIHKLIKKQVKAHICLLIAFIISIFCQQSLFSKVNSDVLNPNEQLRIGESIVSPNGRFTLVMQSDGNLVLYQNGVGSAFSHFGATWESRTIGTDASRVVMQADGNLVIYQNQTNPVWHTKTFLVGLGGDEELAINEKLTSRNGRFDLILQADNNLVLYHLGIPIWASNTLGSGATRLRMQSDGNLVLYRTDYSPVWASGTGGEGASFFVMQNDGNAVIYRMTGEATWQTGTNIINSSNLRTNGSLLVGESLFSPNNQYELRFQEDNNLVLYRVSTGRALWASGTVGTGADRLIMQVDSNLVLYTSNFTPNWASGTFETGVGSWVQLQDDGNLVIYEDGNIPLWASNTASNREDININIALHRTVPNAERGAYENILRFFADGIYEMSNGMHLVHDVTIHQGAAPSGRIDVWWNASEWPRATPSGINSGGVVMFGDIFPFDDNPSDGVDSNFYPLTNNGQCGGGYALAHEFGHYYYGLYDEYRANNTDNDNRPDFPHSNDLAVRNSVMSNQWLACNGSLDWLNFSIAQNNTQQNAQHRMYGASAWEVLARSPSDDPRDGNRRNRPNRTHYPELTQVAPQDNQIATVELPTAQTEARSRLNIIWAGTSNLRVAEQSQDPFTVKVISIAGSAVKYPQLVPIVASVGITRTIARANVRGTIANPDGTDTVLSLRDDGISPDVEADDGLFSGLLPYHLTGVHTVTAYFNNDNGNAFFTDSAFGTQGPNGEQFRPKIQIIGENFNMTGTVTVSVIGDIMDDHANDIQNATIVPNSNVGLSGVINSGGDKDVFRLVSSGNIQTILRVSNFAFDMKSKIRILRFDGSVLAEYDFAPQGDNYFYKPLTVPNSESFYVEISHRDGGASSGAYEISFGASLPGENEPINIFLPVVLR